MGPKINMSHLAKFTAFFLDALLQYELSIYTGASFCIVKLPDEVC